MKEFIEKKIDLREAHAGQKTFSVLVAGDFCPREDNGPYVAENAERITADIQPVFASADYRVLQWETTLTTGGEPIVKSGPNLRCVPEAVAFGKALDIDLALCANNHFGDYGDAVVIETLQHLHDAGMATVGAGSSLEEAKRPYQTSIQGVPVTFHNYCEHEFGLALAEHPGTAPLDPIGNGRAVAAATTPLRFVMLHGGHEQYAFPTHRMVQLFTHLADCGASAVWNCHTHCPGGWFIHRGSPITCSPGNFWFPSRENALSVWSVGHLVKYHCDEQGVFAFSLIPYTFNLQGVHPMDEARSQRYFAYLDRINQVIADDALLQRYFEAWCTQSGIAYLSPIQKFQPDPDWPPSVKQPERFARWRSVRNLFTCEAHHDLLKNTLWLIEQNRLEEAREILPEVLAFQQVGDLLEKT